MNALEMQERDQELELEGIRFEWVVWLALTQLLSIAVGLEYCKVSCQVCFSH